MPQNLNIIDQSWYNNRHSLPANFISLVDAYYGQYICVIVASCHDGILRLMIIYR